jgi:osmotically-inducible protein OsmY
MPANVCLVDESADRDLERRIMNYLAARHVPGLRHLEVEAEGGTVTLRGTVSSFYEKQLSQQCCRRVAGVVKLIDAVDVARKRSAVTVAN